MTSARHTRTPAAFSVAAIARAYRIPRRLLGTTPRVGRAVRLAYRLRQLARRRRRRSR